MDKNCTRRTECLHGNGIEQDCGHPECLNYNCFKKILRVSAGCLEYGEYPHIFPYYQCPDEGQHVRAATTKHYLD